MSNSGDPMDCSLPGCFVYGISQARILEWVAISFSKGSSGFRDQTWVSSTAGTFFTNWITREAQLNSFSSVQLFSRVWLFVTHGLQHAKPPCPSTTLRVYSNSCPLNRWCHPAISSSVIPFSCLQSFPASGSFPMSQFFATSGKSIGVSASASVFPTNTQDWSPLGWDWLDVLAVQGTLKSLLQHHSSKASILWRSAVFTVQLSHPYMTTGKTIALTRQTFVNKVMSLLLNMLSSLVITFLPRSKRLLISQLQSSSAVIFGLDNLKSPFWI